MKCSRLILAGCVFLWIGSFAASFAQSDSPLLEHINNPESPPQSTSEAPAGETEAASEAEGKRVFVLPVRGMISDVMLESMQRRVEQAHEEGVDVVVFEMDTWGGLVTSALNICDYIKSLDDVHTIAWVNPKAISAGAMISVACDEIVVGNRARFGDCAPISIGGDSLAETERSKATSPILEEFRDSATQNGYPVALCEAMVQLSEAVYQVRNTETDELIYIYESQLEDHGLKKSDLVKGVKRAPVSKDKKDAEDADETSEDEVVETIYELVALANPEDTLLTISQDETLEYGFATAMVKDDAELATHTDAADGEIDRYEITWSEEMVNWLTDPSVRSLLLMVAMICGYMELQSPGVGLPGAVAAIALTVFVVAPYMAGLAGVMDVLLITIGIVLILVELFVLPGFGVAGLSGMLCLMVGAMMTFVQSEPGDPDNPGWAPGMPELQGSWDMLHEGMLSLCAAAIVSMVGIYFLTKHFGAIPLFKGMRMEGAAAPVTVDEEHVAAGVIEAPVKKGEAGVTLTDMHPVGRARFGNRVVDVVSQGGWIEAGKEVRVIEVEGVRVVVKEVG
jgi:membrane-bound serine protease (ClpP class)